MQTNAMEKDTPVLYLAAKVRGSKFVSLLLSYNTNIEASDMYG